MMKKLAALILSLMLMASGWAMAEDAAQITPMDDLFLRAKEALLLLSEGEVDMALEKLAFVFDVESEQTEETFRQLVNEAFLLLDIDTVQLEVAVCWLDAETGVWHLGIPVVEPVSWDVEALVLDSRDLMVFCGYSASNWGALEEASALAEQAWWNTEYLPGDMVLFADE